MSSRTRRILRNRGKLTEIPEKYFKLIQKCSESCNLLRSMKNRFEPTIITVYVIKNGRIIEQAREIPILKINEVMKRSAVFHTENMG